MKLKQEKMLSLYIRDALVDNYVDKNTGKVFNKAKWVFDGQECIFPHPNQKMAFRGIVRIAAGNDALVESIGEKFSFWLPVNCLLVAD